MKHLQTLLFLFLVAPLSSLAPAQDHPLTSRDLLSLRQVTGAAIAPDGATIACTLAVPRDPLGGKDGAGFVELHVVGTDGKLRPFITGDVNVGDVAFVPDGTGIAFTAKRTGDKNRALYVIPLAGGEAKKVFEHETDIGAVAFHPTLRRIAFLATPAPPKARKELQEKGFTQEVFEEDWTASRVFIVDLDTPGTTAKALDVPGHLSEVRWTPDGRRLLVTVAPTPLVDHSYMQKRLQVVDAGTGEVITKVEHSGKLGMSTLAPDGALVAFVMARDENDPQPGRLAVAGTSGGLTRELLPDFPGHFLSCAFLDKTTLLYLADRGVETVVGRVKTDGTGNQELLTQPGFVVTSLALSKEGTRAALIAQTPTQPSELFAWTIGGATQRLTTSNPWLTEREFAPQEVVHWKARDGLDLEGLLIHPLHVAQGTKVPLIMVVHGGPEAHFRNGWLTSYSNPGQVAAGMGYAVFHPNYRASTGRGVEFSQLDHKDPAGKEFDDLVDGVDALIAAGLVDGKKVGVTGGSYGGYATGWCATKYSERFAAGVMGFGVSDLISMIGTSDIPTEHYLVHHRLHPWENWQLFLERSPIFHAPECKTPLLILAGKADPRVPPSQSIELYRYLKELGHPAVRLVQYPGEGHGNSRAASRLDYHLRMLQWFDLYLKGSGGPMPAFELDYTGIMGAASGATSTGG